MFNKKLLASLCNFLGLLLVVKFLFLLTMYVWSFFAAEVPVAVIDKRIPGMLPHILFFQELAVTLFYYVLVGAVKSFVKPDMDCCCDDEMCSPEDVPMVNRPMPSMTPRAPLMTKPMVKPTSRPAMKKRSTPKK